MSDRPYPLRDCHSGEDATYVALIHGIGATSPEAWTQQSVQALSDWWMTVRRGVDAETIACAGTCVMGAGHRHLRLSAHGRSCRVDLEALFWGNCVSRPGAGRCAWLVLQTGLLVGLIDTLAALLTAFESLAEYSGEIELAHSTWRLMSAFLRIVMAPVLTLSIAVLVLVSPRWRATIGDALAWSTDEGSRERVKQELMGTLRGTDSSQVVLIGHSQGASIAAELESALRAARREVRLVTLGSGHGLLAAMHTVLPRWSLAKSLLSWAVLLAFSVLTIATVVSVLAPELHAVVAVGATPVRIAGYAWFSNLLPLTHTRELLLDETNIALVVKHQLIQPFNLPTVAIPAEIASTALAVLLVTIGVEPVKRLSAVTHTDAPGIDIVATHDPVAAAMLQLGPAERRRRVSQCGSLLLDHTSYLRNSSVVLGLLAEQVERAAGLHEDGSEDHGALAMEEYHRAGLELRSWTRPLLFVLIAGTVGWFAAGKAAPMVWILAAGACCLASLALTVSSARWLSGSLHDLDTDGWAAVARERERSRRASARWAAVLALAGIPLIGGAAVAFTTPSLLHSIAKRPDLPALTLVSSMIGIVLCALAWRSLFGFQRGAGTTIALALAALVWLLQGTLGSAEVTGLMVALAYWSYRRERQHLATEQIEGPDPFTGLDADTPESP